MGRSKLTALNKAEMIQTLASQEARATSRLMSWKMQKDTRMCHTA